MANTPQQNALNNMGNSIFTNSKQNAMNAIGNAIGSSAYQNPFSVIPKNVSNSNEPASLTNHLTLTPDNGQIPFKQKQTNNPQIVPKNNNQNNTVNSQHTGVTQNSGGSPMTGVLPGTNFQQNLGNIVASSNLNNNPQYEGYINQNNELYRESQGAQTAPYGGTPIPGAGTNNANYQNLYVPQTTASQQGRENEFNVNNSIEQGANAQSIQQMQTANSQNLQGAESVAGLTAPQPYGITTTPYQPGVGQFGNMPGGSAGAFNAGQTQGNVGAGAQFQQTVLPAYNAAGSVKDNLQSFIQQNPTLNPSDFNFANATKSWLQGGQLSDPRYPELSQKLTEFLNTLSPVAGAPGDVTNFKQQLVNSMINGSSSNQSLSQQVDSLYNLAGQKVQSIYQSGTTPYNPNSATQTNPFLANPSLANF